LQDGFNEGVGLSVSIPIFTNRNNKSVLEIDKLAEKTSQLDLQNTEKSLLTTVESIYQNAISAQNQYVAADQKVKALQISYDLIDQQFKLGLKSTLDLLTEKNNLLAAHQSLLQAKYLSIMDIQLLNLYQDLPLEIK
jgi:outer membrane protein